MWTETGEQRAHSDISAKAKPEARQSPACVGTEQEEPRAKASLKGRVGANSGCGSWYRMLRDSDYKFDV